MRAHLRLTLTDQRGRELATRQGFNAVMRQGAELIALLFSGQGGRITHMGVGTSNAPEGEAFDTIELAVDGAELSGETLTPLAADAFFITPDPERNVLRVRIRGTLPPVAAVGRIREAGLIARTGGRDVLYNRVTFDPLEKGDDHELTLFWEVTFPYGDLNWL